MAATDKRLDFTPFREDMPWTLKTARVVFKALGNVAPEIAGHLAYGLFFTPLERAKRVTRPDVMAKARRIRIPYGRVSVRGFLWGHGPLVLLVHGWESKAADMAAFVEPLVARGFQVLSIDAPAHGQSTGLQTDIFHYGALISTIVKRYGGAHAIVAHSFGAASTLFLLSREPTLNVQKCVAIGCPCDMKEVLTRFIRTIQLTKPASQVLKRLIEGRYDVSLTHLTLRTAAKTIQIPGLVAHDRSDRIIPFSDGKAIVEHWPDSKLLATNDLGHFRILFDTSTVNSIVSFLCEGHSK